MHIRARISVPAGRKSQRSMNGNIYILTGDPVRVHCLDERGSLKEHEEAWA